MNRQTDNNRQITPDISCGRIIGALRRVETSNMVS